VFGVLSGLKHCPSRNFAMVRGTVATDSLNFFPLSGIQVMFFRPFAARGLCRKVARQDQPQKVFAQEKTKEYVTTTQKRAPMPGPILR
jgi:hypothetical protein